MDILKLIKHIEILALQKMDRRDFDALYVFHGELIFKKINGEITI